MSFFKRVFKFGKEIAKWEPPQIPVDAKTVVSKEYICKGDQMADGILEGSDTYESQLGHYYRKEDYVSSPLTLGGMLLLPKTIKFYTAPFRPGMDYCKHRTRKNVVYEANRKREAEKIKTLRDKKYAIDLSEYQERLSKPETNKEAVEELQVFASIIKDAHKMDNAALAAKYEKIMMASKMTGFAGMVFGAAAGGIGLAAIASNSASQSVQLANSISDKVGKATSIAQKFGHGPDWMSFTIGTKASAAVAGKVAGMIILGAAANLTIPGATLTALAVISTAAKAGLNIYGQQIQKKKMALQMNSENLLNSITEMIKNNGTIFYKEDNPMFETALTVKEDLDEILNTTNNDHVINALNVFEGDEKISAAKMLNDMMMNAVNQTPIEIINHKNKDKKKIIMTPNEHFEKNLEKLKVMEKANNATLQKLRNRRAKLKRLYNLTRKNKTA